MPRSGEPDKVTCMYPVWVGFGPVHLANELGYFKEEGIEVEEILDDDMPNGIAAMERGDIDCYLRTVGEYQGLGRRKDTQGTIIGTIDLSTGGDGWAADGAIKSVCDLKGKTIAVEPNLPARLIMQMALKKDCDLSIKDTNLTDIAAADAIGVFADPNVAAVGTYEPVLSQVVAAHAARGAHILASSKDYEDLILDVIFVHNDELEANPEKYVKFLRAVYRAVDYFHAHQEEAIPIIAAALLDHSGRLQGDPAQLPLHAPGRGHRADRHDGQGRARLRGIQGGHGPQPRVRLLRRQAAAGGPHRPLGDQPAAISGRGTLPWLPRAVSVR